MKFLKVLFIFILSILLCIPLNARCEELYETPGYIKEIDCERSIVVLEEAATEYKNPVTGKTLELKVGVSTATRNIMDDSEETDDNEWKSNVTQRIAISGDGFTLHIRDGEARSDEELIKEKTDEIARIFSEGDKVKVVYDENFVLWSITKYPQNCTIYVCPPFTGDKKC